MKQRPLIGIVTSVLARSHIRSIVRGAIAQAQSCGCDSILLSPLVHFTRCTPTHAKAERMIYQQISSDAFDGFLYVKDDTTMGSEVIAEVEQLLLRSNKYVMTVDEQEHAVFDSTQYDDYDDFGKVVRHLIEVHGYRKIYCLTGPQTSFQAQNRLRAYQELMTQYGLPYDDTHYTYGTFWVDSAISYAGQLLSGALSMPDAIVCGNDVTAMALIKALQSGGIRVPEDVAVTGYDGFPFTANVDVSLTTYTRNHYQLGADAVRRLYRNMTGVLCRKVHRPESGFIVGNSCGCESIPAKQILNNRRSAVPRMWEEDVFADDMPFDLAAAQTLPDLLHRIPRHIRTLYQAQEIRLYLYQPEGTLHCAAVYTDDGTEIPDAAPIPGKDAASFLQTSNTPQVLFLSPLHMQERQFGLISLTFGQSDRIYDQSFLHFVSDLEVALDRICRQQAAPEISAGSSRQISRREQYETLLRLRTQLHDEPGLPWTVERMCRVSEMSRSTLQKHYKAYFGNSVFEDLILFRVEQAQRLLTGTDQSLGTIAAGCGYSTESYFMKQFKSVTGMTPTAYRNQKRKK